MVSRQKRSNGSAYRNVPCAPPSQQRGWPKDLNAHREGNGQPAGANHLFNDGHARWIKWSHGMNMRTNTIWATGNLYIWRRTLELP